MTVYAPGNNIFSNNFRYFTTFILLLIIITTDICTRYPIYSCCVGVINLVRMYTQQIVIKTQCFGEEGNN